MEAAGVVLLNVFLNHDLVDRFRDVLESASCILLQVDFPFRRRSLGFGSEAEWGNDVVEIPFEATAAPSATEPDADVVNESRSRGA